MTTYNNVRGLILRVLRVLETLINSFFFTYYRDRTNSAMIFLKLLLYQMV